MECYWGIKTNEQSSPVQTGWELKCILLSGNQSHSERAMHCIIPITGHLGKEKLWSQGKDQLFPGRMEGGMNRHSTVDFSGSELFCMLLKWWIYIITHFSKPIEFAPGVNPKVNYELRVILMLSNVGSIDCNKHKTLVMDVDSKGACAHV